MGKKGKKAKTKSGQSPGSADKAASQKKSRITMKDLEEMSDSEGELPPEEEWDEEAKALKEAILSGKYDSLLEREDGASADDESIEEVELGDEEEEEAGENVEGEESGSEEEAVGKNMAQEEAESSDDEIDMDQEGGAENKASIEKAKRNEDDASDDSSDGEKSGDEKVEKIGNMAQEEADSSGDDNELDLEHHAKRDTAVDSDSENEEHGDVQDENLGNQDDEDESDDDDDEGDGDEAAKNDDEKKRQGKRKSIDLKNQVSSKALHIVTQELIAEKHAWPWAETFCIVPPTPLPFGTLAFDGTKINVHDDLKREVAFYDLALQAVQIGRQECKKANIPFSRPEDFFAEMVKSDEHMARVKDRLIFETKKIEAVAQRKSNKEQKLRSKESQANKLAEKSKRKKDHFKAVEEWAQSAAAQRGRPLDDKEDKPLKKGRKRENYDKKYGFGGKRGRFKQNDRKDINDMSSYNPRGNFPGGMKKSAKTASGPGTKRKGKRARDASRSRT